MIKDSGKRREFESGAVRDIAEGKGRADLLPLDVIAHHIRDLTLLCIERYIREGDPKYLWSAIDDFENHRGWTFVDMLLEVSIQYEDGAKKYGDNNWRKGINVHCYIDSGVRHYLKWLNGDVDEPHDRAFVWNMLGAIWTHTNKPELIDLPFAENDQQ